MLEPRRIAARLAAARVASERGEVLGQTVGYQVRFEQVGSSKTSLWFLTEGVLTRKMIERPLLPKAGVVVLDEFHERHLETDLALALVRRLLVMRPELRLVIMSATLGSAALSEQLNAPVLRSTGRTFPVAIEHSVYSAAPVHKQVAAALAKHPGERPPGHTLVFLPGAAEIRRTAQECSPLASKLGAVILPLHGDLTVPEQEAALAPSQRPKIILSTNIAESSVTIDGVQTVIDSGLARIPVYSHWTGISRLIPGKISQASAIQRAGRAGRTGPGRAIRLYTADDFFRRPGQTAPEILRTDLTQVLLQLSVMNIRYESLPWLDAPDEAAWFSARDLLQRLGALGSDLKSTAFGCKMSSLPLAPRLAALALHGNETEMREEVIEFVSRMAGGRLRLPRDNASSTASDIDAALTLPADYSTKRVAAMLGRRLPRPPAKLNADPSALEKSILRAFPDRVGRRQNHETVLLGGNKAAQLSPASSIQSAFFVALDVEDRGGQKPVVQLACSIEPDWILDIAPDRVQSFSTVAWNREAERAEQLDQFLYDGLVLMESRSPARHSEEGSALLARKAIEAGVARLTDEGALQKLLDRVCFAAEHQFDLQPPADLVEQAVIQLAQGLASLAELRQAAAGSGLIASLEAMLPMNRINQLAPTHIQLANGRRAPVSYPEGQPPYVSSRLQDFFGLKETPKIAMGAVSLAVHLLAPNQRPVQVTTDLLSFWNNLYPQVRKELSRRYPRHQWPEKPF